MLKYAACSQEKMNLFLSSEICILDDETPDKTAMGPLLRYLLEEKGCPMRSVKCRMIALHQGARNGDC